MLYLFGIRHKNIKLFVIITEFLKLNLSSFLH